MVNITCPPERREEILNWLKAKDKEMFSGVEHGEDYTTEFFIWHEDEYAFDEEDAEGKIFAAVGEPQIVGDWEEYIVDELGAELVDSVSEGAEYLVCDDRVTYADIVREAETLGVPVISEKQLILKFENLEYTSRISDLGIFEFFITDTGIDADCGGEYGFYYKNHFMSEELKEYFVALKKRFPEIGLSGVITVNDKYNTDRFEIYGEPSVPNVEFSEDGEYSDDEESEEEVQFSEVYTCESCWSEVAEPFCILSRERRTCLCSPECLRNSILRCEDSYWEGLSQSEYSHAAGFFFSELNTFADRVITANNVIPLLRKLRMWSDVWNDWTERNERFFYDVRALSKEEQSDAEALLKEYAEKLGKASELADFSKEAD